MQISTEIKSKVGEELSNLIQSQFAKDIYYLPSGKIMVPRARGDVQGYSDVRILVQNDADFYVTGVTGTYGYWNEEDGRRKLLPLPENNNDEVVFRVYDGASNRLLTGDYVSVDTFFTGGSVGKPLYLVMPFRHIALRNSFLRFEFQNPTENDFQIDFTLHGVKFF